MEMKENNQKKMLLSVLGVAILVVAVIGISFAAYSTVFESQVNTVTTGTVMVNYTESGNAINVTNALPMTDANGIAQTGTGVFSFSVSTKADNALTVPYEINLTKVELACTGENTPTGCYTSMADNQVKAYLTKGGSSVTETTANGKLISELATSTQRSGAKILHSASDQFTTTGEAAKTTNYELRLWIANNVNINDVTDKEFHAKVNVDSHVNPVS